MEAETPSAEITELRNAIASMYDGVRGLLARLPVYDRAPGTERERRLRQAIGRLVISPFRDARVARRLADGHAGASFSPGRLLDLIANWRLQRVLSRATRHDLLAAWESGFNELFSSLNDAAELTLADADRNSGRARAITHLRGAPERVDERAAEVQRLVEAR